MLAIYLSMADTPEEKLKVEEFYNKYKNYLLNYAYKFLKEKTASEDAVHEAFISILKNKDKYLKLNENELKRSATVILRKKCIDVLRKDKKFIKTPMEEVEIYLEKDEKSVEEKAILSDEVSRIQKHLKNLDEETKQILIMKYVEDMSLKEIGEEIGITPKHVSTKIYRGKIKLRKMIEKEENNGL